MVAIYASFKGKDTLWNFSFRAFHETQKHEFKKCFYFSMWISLCMFLINKKNVFTEKILPVKISINFDA